MLVSAGLLHLYRFPVPAVTKGLLPALPLVRPRIAWPTACVVKDGAQEAPPEPPLVGSLAHCGAKDAS